jgi:hypothetical protein
MSKERSDTRLLENAKAEKSLYETIRAANENTMRDMGIDQAIATKYLLQLDDIAELAISSTRYKDDSGEDVERLWIRAGIDNVEPGQRVVHSILLAEISNGMILNRGNFTTDQAVEVNKMALGLREAKTLGALTFLTDSLSGINDPTAGHPKLPPIRK